jgi:hypothetical protein
MKARVLRKQTPGTFVSVSGSPKVAGFPSEANGWSLLESSSHFIFYRQDYFDLSGYTIEDETLFPQSVVVQDMQAIQGSAINAIRWDLVTKKKVTTTDLQAVMNSIFPSPPGAMNSRFSLEEIIFGRQQFYTDQVDISNTMGVTQSSTWGTGDSTASEKLYITQVWLLTKISDAGFNIPEGAYVIPSIVVKEADLEYIMRLKRSHELAE